MDQIIQTRNFSKSYGENLAVDDVTFDVLQGEIFGYIGPNGAGKSTTIRSILGFIRPSKGNITVFGLDSYKDANLIHEKIGYLPSDPIIDPKYTGREALDYFDSIRQIKSDQFRDYLVEVFDCDLSSRISTLSRGNRQKISLIQALMFRPQLLVLDEPTSGLDPLVQLEFNRVIKQLKDDGITVFISSHVLSEVEELCDRIGVVRDGVLVAVETTKTLKDQAKPNIKIEFSEKVPEDAFSNLKGIGEVIFEGKNVVAEITGDIDQLVKAASAFTVKKITSTEPNLDEIFLRYYES